MEAITKLSPEDLKKYREKIEDIRSGVGLSGYYMALPKDLKTNDEILKLLKDRRAKL